MCPARGSKDGGGSESSDWNVKHRKRKETCWGQNETGRDEGRMGEEGMLKRVWQVDEGGR